MQTFSWPTFLTFSLLTSVVASPGCGFERTARIGDSQPPTTNGAQGNVGIGAPREPSEEPTAPAANANQVAEEPSGGDSNSRPAQTSSPNAVTGGSNLTTLHFIGRIDPNAPTFTWSGSAVEAKFSGTGGTATFKSVSGTNFIGVAVDGNAAQRVPVTGTTAIKFGPVTRGEHSVRFTKLNESYMGTFSFVKMETDGALLASAAASRRLEFVGASMTLGYGVEGVAPCSNTAATENALAAFSTVTAAALGADASIVAIAGYGLVRNSSASNDTLLPDIFLRANAVDASSRYTFPASSTPQAVVVNVGTNDYATTGDRPALDTGAMVSAYVNFVATLRSRYPQALIVLTSSPMLQDTASGKQHSSLLNVLQTVQKQRADTNLVVLDFPELTGTLACDNHPTRAQHQAMSLLLQPLLRQKLGW